MRQFFENLLNGGIPADDPRRQDPSYMRRVRTMHGCGIAITVTLPITLIQFLIGQQWVFCGVVIAAAAVSYIASKHSTRGGSLDFAAHAQLFLLAAIIIIAAMKLNGHHATGKAWLLVLPTYAGLVGGMRLARI